MSCVWGKNFKISVFGESHSDAIGVIVDGVPAGEKIDFEEVKKEMARRAPNGGDYSTPRKEADEFNILSGVFNGIAEGTPICAVIYNTNTKSSDYSQLKDVMRPGHSDYGYHVKYNGHNDYRGGGASSGRLTAPMVFAGAIAKQLLKNHGIEVISHILSIADIQDKRFCCEISNEVKESLKGKTLPLIDENLADKIHDTVLMAKADGDSVGGKIECAVLGIDAGYGNPLFESVESVLSSILFAVPAVKGIEFGNADAMTKMRGSESNDSMYYDETGKIRTKTNNNGGVIGGITNGMPIIFNVAIKPTASIFKEQDTVNVTLKCNTKLNLKGRHDPCIVVRAVPVIEAVTAIAIYDIIRSDK